MKKILMALAVACSLASPNLWAADSKAGGIELSGNIDTVAGWQRDTKDSVGDFAGGQLGWFRGATSPNRDTFNFYVDQVELDINKSFGQNIRIRADLDFGRQLSGSGRNTNTAAPFGPGTSNFELEQGYVTANIPLGNGVEFMIGRFNAPIGYYVVDRGDNPTISFSENYNYLTPTNVTGAKFYYSFNDFIDWHVYAINSLADSVPFGNGAGANPGGLTNGAYSAIPSYGTRLGFNWGPSDQRSTVGISYAGGPERYGCNGGTTGCDKHLTHIIDTDWAVKFTKKLLFAGEFTFRQDNALTGTNDRALAAFMVMNFDVNEAWRIFGRLGWMQDRTGFYTGAINPVTSSLLSQNLWDVAIGFGYQITDTTRLKFEYNPVIFEPRNVSGVATSWSHGVAMEFSYNY